MKHDLMAANVALTRKHWAKNFVKTCRALGMTDDEIRAALTKSQQPGAPGAQAEPGLEFPEPLASDSDTAKVSASGSCSQP